MRKRKYTHSQNINEINSGEFKQYSTQLKTIFSYLNENVATASMVSFVTGIPQKCITRYKRDLENQGLLFELEKKKCKHTGCKAWYLTTNKEVYLEFLRKEGKNGK